MKGKKIMNNYHGTTNPDYPKIDLTLLDFPEPLKPYVRTNGRVLLVDGRYGAELFDQLKFWVVWREKACLGCGSHFMLQIQITPGEDFDAEKWSYPVVNFLGAYNTCGCAKLGDRTKWSNLKYDLPKRIIKPITEIKQHLWEIPENEEPVISPSQLRDQRRRAERESEPTSDALNIGEIITGN